MNKILICWIGFADLKAATGLEGAGMGPIGQAVNEIEFDQIVLISDQSEKENLRYIEWLKNLFPIDIHLHSVELTSPTHFGEIYKTVIQVVEKTRTHHGKDVQLTYHLSPGTPAMAAVWVIVAKTRFPATLIESSRQSGVRVASVPFDMSAEFISDLLQRPDERLKALAAGQPPQSSAFNHIAHRSRVMKRIIAKARHIAPRSVPVLIEGESGTGKELLARAIHESSPRRDKLFMAINCGAIPATLLESELFGHEKGAFTGADKQKKGYFEMAHAGTLFLDEIGELTAEAQVKLLRVLQENEIVRVGASVPQKVNVRVIAATNRVLIDEVSTGRFRSDLFYRIAVAVLKLPPIRERPGDVGLLIDHLLRQINEESVDEPGYQNKKISSASKNFMVQHPWPGNVRELQNTLLRAAIWTPGSTIDLEDIREAMLPMIGLGNDRLLNRPMTDGINLPGLMEILAQHYLKKALAESQDNKTKAAEMVGLPSYQTFSNWMKKYHVS